MKLFTYVCLICLFLGAYSLSGDASWEQRLAGIITARVQGDYAAAIDLSREALTWAEEELGKDDKFYFLSLSQLGSSYQMSGELSEAEAVFNRALSEKEQRFGREHPALASSLFHLGQLQMRRGNREAAEALFERANAISIGHVGSHQMIESLAFNLRDQDRVNALEGRYLFELNSYEIELGSEHPELLHALDNLGLLYRYQGRYEEAITMFRRVLVIREKQSERAAMAIQRCVEQLVYCYRAEARFEDADELLERYSEYAHHSPGG